MGFSKKENHTKELNKLSPNPLTPSKTKPTTRFHPRLKRSGFLAPRLNMELKITKRNSKIHVWIETGLLEKLKNEAGEKGVSLSDLVRMRLRGF